MITDPRTPIKFTWKELLRERRLGPIYIGMSHYEVFSKYLDFDRKSWVGFEFVRGVSESSPSAFQGGVLDVGDVEISFGFSQHNATPVNGFIVKPGRTIRRIFDAEGRFLLDSEGIFLSVRLQDIISILEKYGLHRVEEECDNCEEIWRNECGAAAAFDIVDGVPLFHKMTVF